MKSSHKSGRYQRLYVQIEELLKKSDNTIAHMSTVSAVLFHKMEDFFWCGFYRLEDGELIVGPYQGPLACQILRKDTGVCWAGIHQKQTIIVPDVEAFPGHIACDSRSKSEIVVPLFDKNGSAVAVLDVDSDRLNAFDEVDAEWLEKIIKLIKTK